MKNPAALRSGVLAWVERREVEKRRMMQNTAHGFQIAIHFATPLDISTIVMLSRFDYNPHWGY